MAAVVEKHASLSLIPPPPPPPLSLGMSLYMSRFSKNLFLLLLPASSVMRRVLQNYPPPLPPPLPPARKEKQKVFSLITCRAACQPVNTLGHVHLSTMGLSTVLTIK